MIAICFAYYHMVLFQNLQVNGDSDFVTGDFKVFEFDSGNWDQQDAVSNTAVCKNFLSCF